MASDETRAELEVPEQIRNYASLSVEQARRAFDEFMKVARKAAENLEGQSETVRAGSADINRTLLQFTETNILAAFDFAHQMARAKNLDELTRLQAEFIQNSVSAMGEQTQALGGQAVKTAEGFTDALKWPR